VNRIRHCLQDADAVARDGLEYRLTARGTEWIKDIELKIAVCSIAAA
jgi:hypothetical protein